MTMQVTACAWNYSQQLLVWHSPRLDIVGVAAIALALVTRALKVFLDKLESKYRTKAEAAQAIGVHYNTVLNYRKRKSRPTASICIRLAREIGESSVEVLQAAGRAEEADVMRAGWESSLTKDQQQFIEWAVHTLAPGSLELIRTLIDKNKHYGGHPVHLRLKR